MTHLPTYDGMNPPTFRRTTTASSIASTASQQTFVTAYESCDSSTAVTVARQSSHRTGEAMSSRLFVTSHPGKSGYHRVFSSWSWPPILWRRFGVPRRSDAQSSENCEGCDSNRVGDTMTNAGPGMPTILSDNITVSSPISSRNPTSPFPLSSSDPESPKTSHDSPCTTKDFGPGLRVYEEERQTHHESQLIYNDKPNASLQVKFKTAVLFGETGVGKSSLINLMAGHDVARTSSGLVPCAQQNKEYYFTLSSQLSLRVVDTIGIDAFDGPIQTIRSLPQTKDIDLVLLCMKAGRFTASMERTHYLISELLRNHRVPLALVITHLEDEAVMEDWWEGNARTVQMFQIHPVAHACVTAVSPREISYVAKRAESRRALQELFQDVLCVRKMPYMQALCNQLVKLVKKPVLFLMRRQRRNRVRRELEREYAFSRQEAQGLAELITRG